MRGIIRLRVAWAVPAWLLLLVALWLAPSDAWRAQTSARRTWSLAELSIVITIAGNVLYWLALYLSHMGVLDLGRSHGMREPSETERKLADAALRWLCLLMTYGGPLLLVWAS